MNPKTGRLARYPPAVEALSIVFIEKIREWLSSESPEFRSLPLASRNLYACRVAACNLPTLTHKTQNFPYNRPETDLLKLSISSRWLTANPRRKPDTVRQIPWAENEWSNLDMSSWPSPRGISSGDLHSFFETTYSRAGPDFLPSPFTNRVKGEYLHTATNAVWYCDTTEAGGIWFTLVLDSASRLVLGSYASTKAPTSLGLSGWFTNLFLELGRKPVILHSDKGSIFTSQEFQDFLTSEGITFSGDTRHAQVPGNNVIESFNSKIKQYLHITKTHTQNRRDFAAKSVKDRLFIFRAALAFLSETTLSQVENASPAELYEALEKAPLKLDYQAASDTPEGQAIKSYQSSMVIFNRARTELDSLMQQNIAGVEAFKSMLNALLPSSVGDISDFHEIRDKFAKFYDVMQLQFANVTSKVEEVLTNQEIVHAEQAARHEELITKIEHLSAEKAGLETNVTEMVEILRRKEQAEHERQAAFEARKFKRLNAKKLPKREELTADQKQALLTSVKGKDFYRVARDRVALVILFTWGIRIDMLRFIKVQHLKKLLKGVAVRITVSKTNRKVDLDLPPTPQFDKWANVISKEFNFIKNHPDLQDKPSFYNVARETLNKRLNKYFKQGSIDWNMYIRSHSCRVTVANAAIKKFGIVVAKQLLGHQSINSTLAYQRGELSLIEAAARIDEITPDPPDLKVRKGRPRKNPYKLKVPKRGVRSSQAGKPAKAHKVQYYTTTTRKTQTLNLTKQSTPKVKVKRPKPLPSLGQAPLPTPTSRLPVVTPNVLEPHTRISKKSNTTGPILPAQFSDSLEPKVPSTPVPSKKAAKKAASPSSPLSTPIVLDGEPKAPRKAKSKNPSSEEEPISSPSQVPPSPPRARKKGRPSRPKA